MKVQYIIEFHAVASDMVQKIDDAITSYEAEVERLKTLRAAVALTIESDLVKRPPVAQAVAAVHEAILPDPLIELPAAEASPSRASTN